MMDVIEFKNKKFFNFVQTCRIILFSFFALGALFFLAMMIASSLGFVAEPHLSVGELFLGLIKSGALSLLAFTLARRIKLRTVA